MVRDKRPGRIMLAELMERTELTHPERSSAEEQSDVR